VSGVTARGRILIVDDHPLIALGLQLALTARGWEVETTSGPTAAAVVAHACIFGPECVVLDVHLGVDVGSGVDLIRPLRQVGTSVVMLTGETDRFTLASCLEAGAMGWISKGAGLDEVISSIEDAAAGRTLIGCGTREALLDELRSHRASIGRVVSPFQRLTSCEQRVLGALIEGRSAEEIAEAHFVALTTIRSQIRAILHKLGVRSQLAAVAQANRAGWQPPAPVRQLVGAR
jgi:two-component system, NarL family, nitrate/nitrite response regulator NarL